MAETETTPDEVLLSETDGSGRLLVCSIFEDQRPLKGAAGQLDWRLKGFLSRFVMSGRISGAQGEFVYVPIKHRGHIRHLMLVGLGPQSTDSAQKLSPQAATALLGKLARQITRLNFKSVTVSRSSFPFLKDENRLRTALEGVQVEFIQ